MSDTTDLFILTTLKLIGLNEKAFYRRTPSPKVSLLTESSSFAYTEHNAYVAATEITRKVQYDVIQ